MMTEFHFGKLIGKGMERACYENMDNPNTCFKVSRKEHSKQTIREGAYFKYLPYYKFFAVVYCELGRFRFLSVKGAVGRN